MELQPEPEPDALAGLLVLAERDCFVGSSLTAEADLPVGRERPTIDS